MQRALVDRAKQGDSEAFDALAGMQMFSAVGGRRSAGRQSSRDAHLPAIGRTVVQ
ncbi:MAG TPA: hypothetical protein VFM38_07645 [Candidatus Limnocylindrales bacterium]|nr:hypothetical protein [Candidatus Limnocylindrales bacterium]